MEDPAGDAGGTAGAAGSAAASASVFSGGSSQGGVVSSGGAALEAGGATASGGASAAGSSGSADAAAGSASGGAAPDAGATGTRPVPSPPRYRGTVNDAAGCTEDYATQGFEPDDDRTSRHPLFLYFTGTNFFSDAASFRDQSAPAANAVTEAMARRGFVSLWVEYDNGAVAWLSDHKAQLDCLFGDATTSALSVLCALPEVDCDLGIATWGHSQGAYVADSAHGFDARVRATWLAGYGGDAVSTTPKDRLRVENGENDTTNGQIATVNRITGLTSADCPDPAQSACFRPDGSGWVIVRAADCVTSSADHCWFDKKTCTDTQVTLEPNWIDPASTKPFALESNADWVAETVRRR